MEYQMIIGGEAVKSSNFFDVHDPATGEKPEGKTDGISNDHWR